MVRNRPNTTKYASKMSLKGLKLQINFEKKNVFIAFPAVYLITKEEATEQRKGNEGRRRKELDDTT